MKISLPKIKLFSWATGFFKERELYQTPEVLIGFLGAAFITLAAFFSLLLAFGQLPPQVPLLFTTGASGSAKIFLFSVPVLSLVFIAINAAVAEFLIKRGDRSAAIFPAFVSFFVSALLSTSLVKIIKIFPVSVLPLEQELYWLLLPLGLAVLAGFSLTYVIQLLARRLKLVDKPHGPHPKVRPIPRLGALPIFLTFAAVAWIFAPHNPQLLSLLLGGALITAIQTIDDIRPLPPLVQGIGHILAALIVIVGGIGVDFIGNPLSGFWGPQFIRLDSWQIPIQIFNASFVIKVWADLLVLAWIFALINVVDWLDGLDGLAAGISTIAAGAIVAISIMLNTPLSALLGIVLAGTLLGFLPFNFYPAKIYLGGGAFLLGYLLAVLSIFSGAKTGTALLVLAIPIIDAALVILRRLIEGRSPFMGDKTHLHHRLMEAGLSHPQIVLLEWGVVLTLAVAAVALKGFSKFAAIGLVFAATLLANKLILRKLASKSQTT